MIAQPVIKVIRPPRTLIILPDTGEKATIARPPGTMARPAARAPRPYPPASVGSCSCWVLIRMFPIRAKPTRIDARLVNSTGGRPEVRRSTSAG